jgi:hypothetical protein
MTDESAFQSALDELAALLWPAHGQSRIEPDLLDQLVGACAVFADWLEEQGDWRAVGYRWLSRNRKLPRPTGEYFTWWRFGDNSNCAPEDLPARVWDRLPGNPYSMSASCREYPTRRDAEWALCKAILSLEADG